MSKLKNSMKKMIIDDDLDLKHLKSIGRIVFETMMLMKKMPAARDFCGGVGQGWREESLPVWCEVGANPDLRLSETYVNQH